MGADIHLFIEYRRTQPRHHRDGTAMGNDWRNFGDRFNPGRNYRIFGMMAGVRDEDHQMFEPRGMPQDIAFSTRWEYLISVDDRYATSEHFTSTAKAARWVREGSSRPWGDRHVTDPDAHTPSWLSVKDYADLLHAYQRQRPAWEEETEREIAAEIARNPRDLAFYQRTPGRNWALDPDYGAILGACCALEEAGQETRLVFYFDN